MTQAVIDYSIHVFKEVGDYRVLCECALSGESDQSTLSAAEITHFGEVGKKITAGTVGNDALIFEGQGLFEAILKGNLRRHFSEARAVARANAQSLRIVVKFDHITEMHEIPWEILHDGESYIAILPQSPVVRYIRQSRPIAVDAPPGKLRILFTTASPNDLAPLDLRTEEDYLRDNLRSLGDRVHVEVMHDISFRNIHFRLTRAQATEQPFHIWHHAGHGVVDANGTFLLALVANEKADLHAVNGFSSIIQACPSLRMALLNVCYAGGAHGLGAEFASLNLPYVYGYRSPVLDRHALDFAYQFYALLPDVTIEASVGVARSAVYSDQRNQGRPSWAQPVLYARTQSATRLLPEAAVAPAPESVLPQGVQTAQTKVTQRIGVIQSSGSVTISGLVNEGATTTPSTNADIEQTVERIDGKDVRITGQKNFADTSKNEGEQG